MKTPDKSRPASVFVTLRMPVEQHRRIKEISRQDDRSIGYVVRTMVREGIERRDRANCTPTA